jgi:hypothetical protein
VLREIGSLAAVFFSHPDENKTVEQMIATDVEASLVLIGLTRKR